MIVDTTKPLDSSTLWIYCESLQKQYPFLKLSTLGKSVCGQDIPVITLGSAQRPVMYVGVHHSLEWITGLMLIKFVEDFCATYAAGKKLAGFDTHYIFESRSIIIVPMLNVDGTDIVINGKPIARGCDFIPPAGIDLSTTWQANARGVDLNHNYDAGFLQSKALEKEMGITGPGPTRYSGPYPESEPEVRALTSYVYSHNIQLAISYHSQGEVIYWEYGTNTPQRSQTIAEIFSALSGYSLERATGISSYGGFKDWFINTFLRPGFTIEVGMGKNPLPLSQFNTIYQKNIEILLIAPLLQ